MKIKVKVKEKPKKIIEIKSPFIKLDAFLKLADAVQSGGHAKIAIQNEEVKVNGEICTARGKKLRNGDIAEFDGRLYEVKADESADS